MVKQINRREFVAAGLMMAVAGPARMAHALTESEAKAHVSTTLEELKALLRQAGAATSRAPELRRIMESRANLPLIARFSAGVSWRQMDDDQQARFVGAFSHHLSIVYAKRFDEYSGDPEFRVGRVLDAGRKGLLVETPILLEGQEPVSVEWLVSDRGGSVQIVDLLIEGVSLAATQREEMGAMFERRKGDVESMIAHLQAAS